MPRAGFYNDNEYRAYPFVYKRTDAVPSFAELPSSGNKHMIYLTRDTGDKYRWTGSAYTLIDPIAPALPDACILDAGVIMGLMSEFDPTQHSVWLESVSRAADVFTFTFRTDAPGAAGQLLTFTRPADTNEWLSEPVDAADWEGFFVTGPLASLADQLTDGANLTFHAVDLVLEPARVQSLVKSYLRSVSLGNYRRTLVTPTDGCENSSAAVNVREIVVNAEGLQGDLRLKEGYNCRISQTDFNREIRVAAAVGAGLIPDNELCSRGGELPLYTGEEPPEGSPFLSGGPACDETISTINGVGGPNVTIVGGSGVGVTTDNENFSVRVALDSNNLVGNCGA
jgi:hypothetical protein